MQVKFEIKSSLQKLKRLAINIMLMCVSVVICILLAEVLYRYQVIDFYKQELSYLNKKKKNKKQNNTVLVFGDSFTASANSYVNLLNDSFPDMQFINAAIPGVGVQEINIIAKKRIEEFSPNMVIAQFYVGNDLLDIKKPINWNSLSLTRNCYWYLSSKLFVLRYFNYKLGQFKNTIGQAVENRDLKNDSTFSIEKFSKREKLLLDGDPQYYEKSIMVSNEYEYRFQLFITNLNAFIELCEEKNIPITILIIPASCQVSNYYKGNLEKNGAQFKSKNMGDTLYPFVAKVIEGVKNKSVSILNPLSTFQKHDSIQKRLYYENDLHLNDYGNSVLANFIINEIRK